MAGMDHVAGMSAWDAAGSTAHGQRSTSLSVGRKITVGFSSGARTIALAGSASIALKPKAKARNVTTPFLTPEVAAMAAMRWEDCP